MTVDVHDVVTGILAAHSGADRIGQVHLSGFSKPAWNSLADGSFPWVGLSEDVGGAGGTLVDLVAVARATGSSGTSVPLVETALASWLRAQAGLGVVERTSTVSILPTRASLTRTGDGWRVEGELSRVPWARFADELVAVLPCDGELHVAVVPLDRCSVEPGSNLAGEGRDNVVIEGLELASSAAARVAPEVADVAFTRGALCRAAQMAGALHAVRDLTVGYAGTRQQFGRPLSAFQLIQTRLALIEEGTASVSSAVEVAAEALEHGSPGPSVAAAKILAGIAADEVVAHSHQIHGALGLTAEYGLHRLASRLAAWRWEFGSARLWSGVLAADAALGARSLWDTITHSLTERTH